MSDNSSIIRHSAQSFLKICNSHWLGFERAQPILSRSQPVEKSVHVPDLEPTGCRLLPAVEHLHSPPGQKKPWISGFAQIYQKLWSMICKASPTLWH
jgi:hypothetical protein